MLGQSREPFRLCLPLARAAERAAVVARERVTARAAALLSLAVLRGGRGLRLPGAKFRCVKAWIAHSRIRK